MDIDSRKQRVLEAIIKDYVATAEPVGSRTIARKYNLGVSSATIRNEMADLEEMGLIEQPHTSAGRIPSQLGYRYYVDCLMEAYNLTDEEQVQIQKKFLQKTRDLEQMVLETSKLLSQFTNYTAMVTGPIPIQGRFKQIQLIQLQPQTALLLAVTESGAVIHKMLEFPEPVSAADLYQVSQTFNAKLQGITFNEMQKTLFKELYAELQQQREILNTTLELLDEYLHSPEWEKVYLGGIINILNQPEFRDVEKIRRILGVLEEEDEIRELLTESSGAGVTVRIGGENRREEFQDCSVVTVTYEIDNNALGRVGLLGPTRMEYPKATSFLEYIAMILSEALRGYRG